MKQAFLFSVCVSLLCICDATCDLRTTVCETSQMNDTKKFCKSTLNSHECACATDVNLMGLFAASKIAQAANNVTRAIVSLKKKIPKGVASSCNDSISDAMDSLTDCIGYLNKTESDFDTFESNADGILEGFKTCESGFSDPVPPLVEPARVTKVLAIARKYTDVLLVIKNYLRPKN